MSNNESKTFVSDLQPISQQIGEHIITALQQPKTAAVITSIMAGFPTDRIVSTAVTMEQMLLIRQILQPVIDAGNETGSEDEERQIGFQLPPSDSTDSDKE